MKQRVTKKRIGQRINVEFWDHTIGSGEVVFTRRAGWLLSYTRRDVVMRYWISPFAPGMDEADKNDFAVLRSTIENLWFPDDGPWATEEPKL